MNIPFPAHVPLAYTTRGGQPENIHWGSAAVVGLDGRLLARAGDASALTFARSTIKPFQALPFVRAGGLERFGWGQSEAALLCASHCAQDCHVDVVQHMLGSAGNAVADLGCGAHVPMDETTACRVPQVDAGWTAIHNNCSGKHAGFLASCRLHGWTREDYLDPAHALQCGVRAALADFAQVDVDALPLGTDGCSAPIYALPLERLAFAFARLARGEADSAPLRDAMLAQPHLISGSGRFDLLLATQGGGDWVVKGGADGLQLIASVARGVGVAVKIADGNLRALNAVVVDILCQLGWFPGAPAAPLAAIRRPEIRNWRGVHTGDVLPCAVLDYA